MKRLAAVACAGISALAVLILAAPAGAAVSPKLAITPTNSGGANLIISGGVSNPAEDAFQKIQIFVPTGFGLKSPVGGATVGTVTGHALVKDVDATQEQNFSGKITAIGLTDPAVAFENATCDNTTHAAVWMHADRGQRHEPGEHPDLRRQDGGHRDGLRPVQARHVPALARPDAERPEPQPAGHQAQQLRADADRLHDPTKAGDYRWRSLWTPYTPGTGTVNTAGTVEAQSIVRIPPGLLSLAAQEVAADDQRQGAHDRHAERPAARSPASPPAASRSASATARRRRSSPRSAASRPTKTGTFLITSRSRSRPTSRAASRSRARSSARRAAQRRSAAQLPQLEHQRLPPADPHRLRQVASPARARSGRGAFSPRPERFSSQSSVAGRPNAGNGAGPKVVISAMAPSSMRRTSSLNGAEHRCRPAGAGSSRRRACGWRASGTSRQSPSRSGPNARSSSGAIASRPSKHDRVRRHRDADVLAPRWRPRPRRRSARGRR